MYQSNSGFGGAGPFLEDHRAETAYIHESSWVDTPCRIGEHTAILHFSHIMANTVIGSFCRIGRNVSIASGVLVGDKVQVMDSSKLNSGVILESEVSCGPGSIFTETRFVRAKPRYISQVSPTLVRQGAKLGANTTIASGFTVGRFAFVEAGTVVDRNIPDFAVVYGNPLRFAGWRCECGQFFAEFSEKAPQGLFEESECSHCGRRYQRQSQWKMLQLTQGDAAGDSDSQFNPAIRQAQGPD
jgi:UDP-2-acetamido-3-amino-2,3-dideoxy-glucuronate N-acetyltransferase